MLKNLSDHNVLESSTSLVCVFFDGQSMTAIVLGTIFII